MKSFLFIIVVILFSKTIIAQCSLTATINASSINICSGQGVTLTPVVTMGTAPFTYTWSAGLGITTQIVVTPNVTTTYTVDIMDSSGCVVSPTVTITIYSNPTLTVNSPTICSGEIATLVANGTSGIVSYYWSPPFYLSNTVAPTVYAMPTSAISYTVQATDYNGCIGYASSNITVSNSPTITAYSTNPICNGVSTTSIICSGANTYTLFPSAITGNGIFQMTPTVPTTFTVTGTGSNGCSNDTTFTVYSAANPTLILDPSSTICIGTTATITVSAFGGTPAYSYTWSSAQFGSTATLNTSVTITQSVVASDSNGCQTAIETHTIFVDNSCQDVWPGDVNSDGIADNTDILELGLHYTQTGAARTTIDNTWQGFHATNWVGTITNGKNLNHSDCNGDGTINNDDTLAIYNNYGLTHTFKLSNVQSNNSALNIVPDQTMVDKGKWGTASIYIGDATNIINNVNGVAYTLNYDNTLIEQDSVYLTYQNSFIDAGQNLHFRKTDFTTGALYTASTHTNNTNVSGFGKIATLHYKIRPDLATDSPLNLAITQAVVSNASGSITPITSGASTVIAIGASVGIKDYETGSSLVMYPNPTNGVLHFDFAKWNNIELVAPTSKTSVFAVICIYNALGALVLKENITTNASTSLSNPQTTINISNFAKGLYLVELQSNNEVLHRAKLIKE